MVSQYWSESKLHNFTDLTIHLPSLPEKVAWLHQSDDSFTPSAFSFGFCLCGVNWSHLKDRWPVNMVKHINLQMISILHGLGCLTSGIWPFTLHSHRLHLYWTNFSHFKDRWAVNFLNTSVMHNTSMIQKLRLRMNGQITEVKTPWTILR